MGTLLFEVSLYLFDVKFWVVREHGNCEEYSSSAVMTVNDIIAPTYRVPPFRYQHLYITCLQDLPVGPLVLRTGYAPGPTQI